MAKTIAPLLSFSAGGQIAKTGVYSTWKGIPYVRRYTVPANPRTTRQLVTRNIFRNLQRMWLLSPSDLKAPFQLSAQGRPFTANNRFTSVNLRGVDTEAPPTDYSFFQGSPGALGGLPPTGLVLTPTSSQITAAVGAPEEPDDWQITRAVAVLFRDQDPQADFVGEIVAGDDATPSYSIVFTGLDGTTDYVVSAWFQWERPDGKVAYSTALTDIATTS